MKEVDITKNKIVKELYEKYYFTDRTPENLISSHWKFYKEQFKVEFPIKGSTALLGVGFGNMQNKSKIIQVCDWITIGSYLPFLKNKNRLLELMRNAIHLAKRMGFMFSYDCFRQVCILNLIMSKMRERERVNVINIGDGYGFLSALIKEVIPNSLICLVDLGKTLLFQSYYCEKAHPNYTHCLVSESQLVSANYDFIYCPTEYLEKLNIISFDFATNIASMQEMNQATINFYFDFMRRRMFPDNLFYCCNRERKEMPGGEIADFYKYPWYKEDVHLIDEECPWYRYFITIRKVKGFPLPNIKYFDGIIRHRLTVLHTSLNGREKFV